MIIYIFISYLFYYSKFLLILFRFFSSVYWNRIIETAHLMRDLYYKRNPAAKGSSSNISVKSYFEMLAMDEHASSFSGGPAEVFQWIGHPIP